MSDSMDEQLVADEARMQAIFAQADVAVARAARATALQAEIDAATTSVWSPGREVRVSVSSNGLISRVEYSARALSLGPEALASVTLRTVRRAMAMLQSTVDDLTDREPDDGVGAMISGRYHSAFADALSRLDDDGSTITRE